MYTTTLMLIMLFLSTEAEGSNKARLTSALITGTLITGDDYSSEMTMAERQQKNGFRMKTSLKIARSGTAFMPVDGNTGDKASELFMRKNSGYLYIAVLNYSAVPKQFNIPLRKLGLNKANYTTAELFGKKTIKISSSLQFTLKSADAAIFKVKL